MPRIAILIPTNGKRQDWVDLVIKHYHAKPEPTQVVAQWISKYEVGSTLIYFSKDPDFILALEGLLDAAQGTPYVVFSGDDDFHLPGTLQRMAGYLESHPELDAVYGESIMCEVKDFEIKRTWLYYMNIEKMFWLQRYASFQTGLQAARLVYGSGRATMNRQAVEFNSTAGKNSGFMPGLQLFRTHHAGREQDQKESALLNMIERYGGGWVASWMLSRAGSRRAIERKFSPFYYDFQQFKWLIESKRNG